MGNHNGGAARAAVTKFGAVMGHGEGLQGHSYAIPSTDGLEKLAGHVRKKRVAGLLLPLSFISNDDFTGGKVLHC